MNRSRSPVVSVLAFFRMRTMIATEATRVVPLRASIVTSPLLTLGCPNLPATKNGTEAPLVGTCSVRLLENAPVVPLRKRIAPPPADVAVIPMLTVGVETPDGLVTRIRHG